MRARIGPCIVATVAFGIGYWFGKRTVPEHVTWPVSIVAVSDRSDLQACRGKLRIIKENEDNEVRRENYILTNFTNHEYVRLLYQVILNREPEDGGWRNWEGLLDDGNTRGWVAWNILQSDEFRDTHPHAAVRPADKEAN